MKQTSPTTRLLASACAATLLLAALPTAQQPAPAPRAASTGAAATRSGFSVERLRRVDALLQRYVDEKRLAGAVALVLRDGQPVYERAVGWSDKEAARPMAMDTIFRIASQTKAMTSVAVLSLMEEGRLNLTDPVSRFVPAFATTTVSVAGGGAGDSALMRARVAGSSSIAPAARVGASCSRLRPPTRTEVTAG